MAPKQVSLENITGTGKDGEAVRATARRIAIIAVLVATTLLSLFWGEALKAWIAFPLLGVATIVLYAVSVACLAVDLYLRKGGE